MERAGKTWPGHDRTTLLLVARARKAKAALDCGGSS